VGNLEGPNGKEGKEGAEAEVGVATSTDQRPANERRFEPLLHPIQKIFVPVINSDPFYYVIMGAIFVNCIQLATTSPLDDDPQGMKDMYEVIDWILFSIFCVEFVLKHLALFHHYWCDNWNILDGTIVIFSCLGKWPAFGDYPAARVLRVIRPLRVLGKLDGMKKIFATLANAAAALGDTLLLCCLIFFMFGIVGCTLFAGVTRHRCYVYNATNPSQLPWLDESDEVRCGGAHGCDPGEKCVYHSEAPNYSITSFDNIPIGFLTLFVAITLEGWVDVMYLIQDGYSWVGGCLYFCMLIIFGSLFTLNLALAVICDAYDNQDEDWEVAMEESKVALKKVHLDLEANNLDKIGMHCNAAKEQIEGSLDRISMLLKIPEDQKVTLHEEQGTSWSEDMENSEAVIDEQRKTIMECSADCNAIAANLEQANCPEFEIVGTIGSLMEEMELMLDEEEEEDDGGPAPALEEFAPSMYKWVQESPGGMRSCLWNTRMFFYKIATSSAFDMVIMFFILFNTTTLAMFHAGETQVSHTVPVTNITVTRSEGAKMDQGIADALDALNYVFIVVFTLEVLVKVIGLGVREYVKDGFNIFDFIIVLLSFVELGLDGDSSLSALRTFRLARIFKLAKRWKALRDLVATILDTLPAMSYLSVLLCLFMFIMSVAGMMFFGGKFNKDEIEGRHLYDNFGISMVTVFQQLTGENWNTVLYDGINATSGVAVIYFLVLQVLGGFVILNLFLAILLSNFGSEETTQFPSCADIKAMLGCGSDEAEDKPTPFSGPQATAKVHPESVEAQAAPEEAPEVEEEGEAKEAPRTPEASSVEDPRSPNSETKLVNPENNISVGKILGKAKEKDEDEKIRKGQGLGIEDMDVQGRALYYFESTNINRRKLALLVGWVPSGEPTNTFFNNFILAMIVISSVLLAVDQPDLDPDSGLKTFLNWCDIVFTILFTIEMLIKWVVYGFMFTPDAYMKNGWNLLDFFIVITSILALPANAAFGSGDDSPFASLKVLRTFRAFRPLRMINRRPGLKIVVDAIIQCLPEFVNISIVMCLVYLVFAIMGCQLWAGKFWSCNDKASEIRTSADCVGTYDVDGVATAREWTNMPINFDDVFVAMLTLFEVASLEIWLDVMYAAMDAPDNIGEQPTRYNQGAMAAIYFIIFVIIGAFLMLNLFVGAVVDNFNRIKKEMDKKGAIMTKEQEAFVQSMKTMFNKKPSAKAIPPPKTSLGGLRYKLYKIIFWDATTGKEARRNGTPLFDHIIMVLITLNIVVMALPVWTQPNFPTEVGTKAAIEAQDTNWNEALEKINYAFNGLFIIEATMKLMGLGCRQYFQSGMNTFDFCIVCVSVVGMIVDIALGSNLDPSISSVISVVKAGRVVRIFRLAMRIKGIRKLLETLIYTLPSLWNVTMLLLIVLFIFTVLGMAFFGKQEYNQGYFSLYNHNANFRYFWTGFLTLFRMSTGESWNGLMHDSMETVSPYAWVYYCVYMIVASYLLFQLIVAVVLEQFSSAAQEDDAVVTPDDIEAYAVTWRDMDPDNTQYISLAQLPIFFKALDPPLGLGPDATNSEMMEFFGNIQLGLHGDHGQAHYVDTFFSLVKNAYQEKYSHRWSGNLPIDIQYEMTQQLLAGFKSRVEVPPSAEQPALENFAALKIQSIARARAGKKKSLQKALTLNEKALCNLVDQAQLSARKEKEMPEQQVDGSVPAAAQEEASPSSQNPDDRAMTPVQALPSEEQDEQPQNNQVPAPVEKSALPPLVPQSEGGEASEPSPPRLPITVSDPGGDGSTAAQSESKT